MVISAKEKKKLEVIGGNFDGMQNLNYDSN